jgi:predicted secreted protein
MADKVLGKNIILYKQNANGTYYFNGGVSEGVIASNNYYQISSTNTVGAAANFTAAYDNTLALFITDTYNPSTTTIPAGTWVFTSYLSITYSLAYSPVFFYKVSKYNGTTITPLATSSSTAFTSTNKTLYNTSLSFPATTLLATDRIVIEVCTLNVGARDVIFYTQGDSIAKFTSTLPTYSAFACSTNCTFNVQVDQKDVTSQTSAWFREFKIDIASWTVTCEGIVILSEYSYADMLNTQLNRNTIGVKFAIDNGTSTTLISGNANITSLSINAPYQDISTYSVSLQGIGAYTLT